MYVLPLNSMPYVGAPVVENGSLPTHAAVEPPRSQPVVLMSAEPTPEELKRILKAIKGTVVLTGSAASGVIGPHIGKMNVSDSDNSYRFLLSLPGVLRDESKFSFVITAIALQAENILNAFLALNYVIIVHDIIF